MTTEPRWLALARRRLGTREVPGPKHSAVIQGWLTKLKAWWRDDETPWCGVFVADCLQESGLPIAANWMRAKAWADYGARLQMHRLAPGAVLVFAREGGGHVGFYVGEDTTHFHVLGGNQGNAVSIARIAKARCIAARWPKGEPVIGGPVWPKVAGISETTNEA